MNSPRDDVAQSLALSAGGGKSVILFMPCASALVRRSRSEVSSHEVKHEPRYANFLLVVFVLFVLLFFLILAKVINLSDMSSALQASSRFLRHVLI